MKTVISACLFIWILLTLTDSPAQNRQSLTRKLDQNKRQLTLSIKMLQEVLAQKRTTIKTVSIYERQIQLREEGLAHTEDKLDALEVDISEAKLEIIGITTEIERIKAEFSEAIVMSYKSTKKMSKMHYVFMASSFNDLIRRLNYLKRIMDFRRLQLSLIQSKKQENSVRINELIQMQGDLGASLKEKLAETEQIKKDREAYAVLVSGLKDQEAKLNREIREREKRSEELEKSIRNAIANSTRTPNRSETASEFVPGNLPWPVKNGYISERFGLHRHTDFKNVSTVNNGVDIICENSSSVYPIFEGVVSAIIQVPGMQTTVLIKHGNYYSVYANLSSVSCNQGEKVAPSSIIGQVGKNQDNVTELHFEIWKGTTKLNPQSWIRKG
ncbi:MAG: murein DD-endopeptidase MepM/ murein hydrolase activator NlpD [bacterium]|jgi:murein DD-endopeptidase MepM/ murein hydrolase activator NlpD